MAIRYVWSGGTNVSPYNSFTTAATTMATAITGAAAGDDFYVASDHTETTPAALTLTFPGTAASPNRVLSVTRAGSVVTAGGAISNSGANALSVAGVAYLYGLTLNCGTGTTAASLNTSSAGADHLVYENCAFNLLTTATASRIVPASSGSGNSEWINCSVSFANASQSINLSSATLKWRNRSSAAAITGATLPTALIATNGNKGVLEMSGLDLSALGSGKTLVAANSSKISIVGCKLGASVTVAATPTAANAAGIRLIGCDSGTAYERNEIYAYPGTLTTELVVIRTIGASDGTTAYSWKIVTNANAKRVLPIETFEGVLWNATTGSALTLTVHCVTDNVTLTTADIWVEAEYLGSSASPLATLISSAPTDQLTAGTNLTSDTEAWTTTGLTTPLKQKFSVTFTPQMAGPIRWRVKVGKASTTVYVDPDPDLA